MVNNNFESGVEPLQAALNDLDGLAENFGNAMTTAFRRSVIEGKRLDDVLRSLALSLSSRALNAALAPISDAIGGALGGVFGQAGLSSGGLGGAFTGRSAVRLTGADPIRSGRWAGRSAPSVSITFNVTTPDAASFRRAEADVSAMLARAVARGRRGM